MGCPVKRQRLGAFSMFKNDKEWQWTKNQVEFFGLTALVIYFVSLLCFEWNCFSFSLACFLLIFVRSWFLWNFVNYSRSSWRHYERKKKKMSMLVAWPVRQLPCAWAENGFSPKFVRIGSMSLWIKKNKQTNGKTAGRGEAVSWPAGGFAGSTWKWINQAPSRCPSPPCSCQLYMPNIHLTLTERTHLSSQALINPPFDHLRYMYWKNNSIWSFKSPANNDVGCICVWEYCFIRKKPTLPFVVLKSKPIKL